MQQDLLLLSKNMKNIKYILLAAVLLAISCEQPEQPSINLGELPIHRGYMQFSTGVSSRAQLAESMRGRSFGVLGYKYSATTTWGTAKVLATPSVFYDQKVTCAENDGTCSYDAYPDSDKSLKEWEEGNYSFFAYHPYGERTGVSLSDKTATNTPSLTYTYGWLNPTNQDTWFVTDFGTIALAKDKEPQNIVLDVVNLCDPTAPVFDLMTAEAIDVNSSDGSVNMNFKHRMFALEILANNYNENSEGTYDARQTITNLVLTLNGLQHRTMTIPMSMQSGEAAPVYNGTAPGTRSFLVTDPYKGGIEIPAFNETTEDGRGQGVATSVSKLGGRNGNAGYLMLIPQTSGLSGSLHWAELKNFKGTISTDFSSGIEFKAGTLYQLYINFVGSGITIALIEAGAWEVKDVEHNFD